MNSFAGLFTFKENVIKTFKKRFVRWSCILTMIGLQIMFINTTFMYRSDLMYLIMTVSFFITISVIILSCFSLVRYQERYLDVIDWCRNIYNLDQYHMLVRPEAISQLDKTSKFCDRLIHVIFVFLTVDSICITLGFAIVSQFLPNEIIGKYQPPLPYYLPFLEKENWVTYTITLILQCFGAHISGTYYGYLIVIFSTISIHFLKYLDLIYETVLQMKICLTRCGNPKLEINNKLLEIETKKWTKTVCGMICNFKK